MKEYSIGQVLFILLKGDTSIHPALVTEEVRKRTIQGSTVEYTVELLTRNGKKNTVMLHELEGHVFDDIASARSYLLNNATKAINDICNSAEQNAEKFFAKKNAAPRVIDNINTELIEELPMVELENGVVARIRLPPELQ